jgi:GNAT superfamily N-acetyltransferase
MFRQRNITEFFTSAPKPESQRPPRIHKTRQSLITEFFGAEAERKRKLAATKAYRERYNVVRKFRKDFHQQRPYQQMLGSFDFLCYCRNEYTFYVIDPRTNSTIAELEIDSDHWLEHVHVDAPYQKHGIGAKLIYFANQHALLESNNRFGIAICVGTSVNTRYRLTNEGAALINSCIRNGILKDEQTFYETPQSPGEY